MEIFLHEKVNYAFRRDKTVAIAPTCTFDLKTVAHDVIWQIEQEIFKDNKSTEHWCQSFCLRWSVGAERRGDSPTYFWISRDCERESVGGVASFFSPTLLFGGSSLLCWWVKWSLMALWGLWDFWDFSVIGFWLWLFPWCVKWNLRPTSRAAIRA